MEIRYRYKFSQIEVEKEIRLREEEYFDSISQEENYEEDGIPKFDDPRNHLSEFEREKVEWDEIVISGSLKNDKTIKTKYLANRESKIIHRKDTDGFECMIQSILISPDEIYISRLEKKGVNESWTPVSISLGIHFKGGKDEEWLDLKKGKFK